MRLIVIDVGNTSTAVGLWSAGRVSRVSHVDGGGKAALAAAKPEDFVFVGGSSYVVADLLVLL